MSKPSGHIRLTSDNLQSMEKLAAAVKMPVSFNALVNYVLQAHGIPGFNKSELKMRGEVARSTNERK